MAGWNLRTEIDASAGKGAVAVRREGSAPALCGKVWAILEPGSRFLVHLDGVFWVGEKTGAASVSLGAGYRFSVSLR